MNLKRHFHDRLSDKIYTTFRELFSNVKRDSVHKIWPKISEYNREIANFVEEINAKYGTTTNYTQLEISEIRHWAETFQVIIDTCSQPVQQQMQAPQISVAVPNPQATALSLREQQEEINMLAYVVEQWSLKELPRVQDGITCYKTVGRNRSSCQCSTPNMSLVPLDSRSFGTITVRDTIGIKPMIGGSNTTTGQYQTTGGIPKLHQINIIILPL